MTTTAEPGTDLAVYEEAAAPALRVPVLPDLPDVDSWIRAMASIAKLADKICETDFVPKEMRGNPAAVTACILAGREFGWGPMLALRSIYSSNGTIGLYARTKRAMILGAGHEFRITRWTNEVCEVAARRKGDRGDPLVLDYTMKDAERAELLKRNVNYRTNPRPMLLARVTTLIDTALFGDVTNGMATAELLGDADVMAEVGASHIELPALPPPDVADLKARAAAQTATAVVVTTEPSPAAPESPRSEPDAATGSAATAAAGEARPYAATLEFIQDKLGELLVKDAAEKLRIVSKLARQPLKRLDGLRPVKAAEVAAMLEPVEDSAGLAALLDDIAIGDDPRGETDGD